MPLILLGGLAESRIPGITEGIAGGIGLIVLLVMVGIAVFFFIWSGIREQRFEYLRNEGFVIEPAAADWVTGRKEAFGHIYGICLGGGVVGCIVSAIPVVIAGVSGTVSEWVYGACIAFLLVIVAISVAVITWASMIKSSYDILLQSGEFKESEKKSRERRNALSGAYWCLDHCRLPGSELFHGSMGSDLDHLGCLRSPLRCPGGACKTVHRKKL